MDASLEEALQSGSRCVEFCVPEAQTLADLTGIEIDLAAVERACDRLLVEWKRFGEQNKTMFDFIESEAVFFDTLFSGAVIRYWRCVGSGVRSGVPISLIESLEPSLQQAHRYFKSLRDKFIAHSVNPFEFNQVVVFLKPLNKPPKGVDRVGVFPGRHSPGSQKDATLLKRLAVGLRARVTEEIAAESERVLRFAQSLPAEPLYCEEYLPSRIPSADDVHRARTKFRPR